MRLTHVEVTYGETRSANFQSCSAEVTLRAELESPAEEVDARAILERRCVEAVHAAHARYEERRVAALLAKAEREAGR